MLFWKIYVVNNYVTYVCLMKSGRSCTETEESSLAHGLPQTNNLVKQIAMTDKFDVYQEPTKCTQIHWCSFIVPKHVGEISQ